MTSASRSDERLYSLGVDARFPNVNQTKHCWQNYVDYHKCIIAKGEDFAPCRQVSSPAPAIGGPLKRDMFWNADTNQQIRAVLARLPVPLPQRVV